jgi:hypothetical protein
VVVAVTSLASVAVPPLTESSFYARAELELPHVVQNMTGHSNRPPAGYLQISEPRGPPASSFVAA